VQCLCHGQTFWGQVTQPTGDLDLQPLDPSAVQPALLRFLAVSPMLHPDNFSPHIQDSQLPPLTVLPAPPSPVTIPQPTVDPLPIANFPTSTSVNPTSVPFPLCCCGFCQLRVVPQRRYQSTQISMEGDSRIGEVVAFSKGGCGIALSDAVENRLSGLVGGDDLMFDGFNVSAFSLRIEWPGYPLWTGKFRARNWGGSQGQISRARLAIQIAKRVAEFIAAMEGTQCAEPSWTVGKGGIQINRLVLDSVSCVSRGSWQPFIRLLP